MMKSLRRLVLVGCVLPVFAQPPDLSYTKTMRFVLGKASGSFQLGASVAIQQTFLTQQGTRHTGFHIPEQSRTRISELRGTFRGKELAPEAITFHYPRDESTFTPPSKVYKVDPPGEAKPGDELSCEYRISFEDPVHFPLVWVPALNRVDKFVLVVEHPKDVQAAFDVYSPAGDLHPVIEREPGKSAIVFQNLPEPPLLPGNPFAGSHAVILTRLSAGEQTITAHTPETFCRWYHEQVAKLGSASEAMKTFLAHELATAATPREKARLLFEFVRSQVRYIGDHGEGHAFIPHAPADVFAKKWGDCKDKAWLLSTLAGLHGLQIHPVLISTDFTPEFSAVNLGSFDHVVCVMELDGALVFMDPTASYSELGDVPDADLLARGFVLDPRNPRWVVITDQRRSPSVELQLQCDIQDPKHGRAKVLLRHGWRSMANRARKEMKAIDQENLLSNRVNRMLAKISIDNFKVVEEAADTLILEADADLADFLVSTELRTYIPASPFRVLSRDLLERSKDALPVEVDGPDSYKLSLQLKGVTGSVKNEDLRLGDPGKAHFVASLTGGKDLVKLDYTYSQPFRFLPEAEREDFLRFCAHYLQLNRKPFMLRQP